MARPDWPEKTKVIVWRTPNGGRANATLSLLPKSTYICFDQRFTFWSVLTQHLSIQNRFGSRKYISYNYYLCDLHQSDAYNHHLSVTIDDSRPCSIECCLLRCWSCAVTRVMFLIMPIYILTPPPLFGYNLRSKQCRRRNFRRKIISLVYPPPPCWWSNIMDFLWHLHRVWIAKLRSE